MARDFDPAAYIEEAAALLDLVIAPEHRPGVVENMARLRTMAELVMSLKLPEETELGPVFRA